MGLVEKELNWVLCSPMFFGPQAAAQAQREAVPGFEFPLPGGVVWPHHLEYFSTAESAHFLTPAQRSSCLDVLQHELEHLSTGRLGLRFEKFLECVLRARFGDENVLNRVAVREVMSNHHTKTWGEFDFLLLNTELNRLEHWESSIKFYLQVKNDPAWTWCWGPGVVDRLDLKGPKIFLQQLKLSSTALGRTAIPEWWTSYDCVKRVFAKGTLFYQWNPAEEAFEQRLRSIVQPHALNDDHLKSWWIFPAHVQALRDHHPSAKLAVIPRMCWMTGFSAHSGVSGGADTSDVFETWDTFSNRLNARLARASERKECLYVGIYTDNEHPVLVSAGFIVTPHFQDALRQHQSLSARQPNLPGD